MSETIAELIGSAEEIAPSAEGEKNESMEDLKFDDDEDEKNVSVDDILGGKSLLMSDSEQEASPLKKTVEARMESNKNVKALEQVIETPDAGLVNKDFEEPQTVNMRQKISALVDSDSEADNGPVTEEAGGQQIVHDISTDEETVSNKKKKKVLALLDSDSEEDNSEAKSSIISKKKTKISKLVDSDSDQEERSLVDNANNKKKSKLRGKEDRKSKEKPKKPTKGVKSNEQNSDEDERATKADTKFSGLVDSDSEQSDQQESDLEESHKDHMEESAAGNQSKQKKNKEKTIRASAKKAIDDMQAIQSEQQRLHREAHISVPYHQPKRHTLQEFLNRRTIFKPLDNLSPTVVKTPKHLKMTPDELVEYAKLMEERAKEATEFFKSESEDETDEQAPIETHTDETQNVLTTTGEEIAKEDNVNEDFQTYDEMLAKDNVDVMDVELPVEGTGNVMNEELLNAADIPMEITSETNEWEEPATSKVDLDPNSESFQTNFEDNQPSTSAKCAIITEVVELPKLDMNTFNMSPSSKPLTPRSKPNEKLKELILAKSANVSPAIKGDPNMVIDLETGDMFKKKPTGVDTLFERLLKTREARKAKESETMKIVSTENGKLEISTVQIATKKETDPKKEQKPGAAYIQLKQNLKSIINQKRLQKKKEEELEHSKCLDNDDEVEDIENEYEEYEPEGKQSKELIVNDDDESLLHVDDEEEDERDTEEIETKSDDDEEENGDDNNNDEDDDEEDDNSENDEETADSLENDKRKNRIIRAFEDDSDEDDVDFLKTPKMAEPAPISATQLQLSATKLFDNEEKRSASDEENELLNLCSGKFTDTQVNDELNEVKKSDAIISQIPITQEVVGSVAEAADELMELCSGTFETQKPTQLTNKGEDQLSEAVEEYRKKIISSDEEEKTENNVSNKPRAKKLTKKMKKKKAKLGFSDDEDEEEIEQLASGPEIDDDTDGEEEKINEEFPETFIDYDSEENEVVVEMTKKDCVKRAANFFQNEAELSESEWGSADEDEKNMDKYDIELGDEDEFDREKLRTELEQIHARKMLDQDIREVRQIQEMFFEDEEQDGVGRQRQFKWRNAETGFSLDENRDENADGNGEGSGDEENEHMWRKIRFEREQLLLEKASKEDGSTATQVASPLSTTLANASTITGGTPTGSLRKLNIITAKKTSVEVKKSSPFLISKSSTVNAIQQQKNVRGSFLVRDKETLTKLASLTKGADSAGSVGAISVKSVKAKNFVFATLTEEEHENQKRKADELLNSSSETGINYMKKRRIEPRREKCLIDQLL